MVHIIDETQALYYTVRSVIASILTSRVTKAMPPFHLHKHMTDTGFVNRGWRAMVMSKYSKRCGNHIKALKLWQQYKGSNNFMS